MVIRQHNTAIVPSLQQTNRPGRITVQDITAPFNNMRTPKFKAQPTNAFFAAVNQIFGVSSQLPTTAERCSYHEAFHETFYSSQPVQAYSHRIKI